MTGSVRGKCRSLNASVRNNGGPELVSRPSHTVIVQVGIPVVTPARYLASWDQPYAG